MAALANQIRMRKKSGRRTAISKSKCEAEIISAVRSGGDVKILAETYCLWPSAAYYLHSIFDESK